ncbi:MAG: hypothetical protein NVS4B6_27570 [Mycobacterium sp.]
MTRTPPDADATKEFNVKVADEFRANDGRVGGADVNPAWVLNLPPAPKEWMA